MMCRVLCGTQLFLEHFDAEQDNELEFVQADIPFGASQSHPADKQESISKARWLASRLLGAQYILSLACVA
jgi:hypothetical protein